MAFNAQVISTFEDLKEHRARVIVDLRRTGFSISPKEEWADNNEEREPLSHQRLDRIDLCVVLVALRRGFIPSGSELSVVEQEYQRAIELDIDLLVFLLAEDSPWPRLFDDLDNDPGVGSWRSSLLERHAVAWFGTEPDSLPLAPALNRWIVKQELDQEVAQRAAQGADTDKESDDLRLEVLRVLLSSPGDCIDDRNVYERVVARFNQDSTPSTGLFVQIIRWEEMAPQIGPGAQEVINQQVGEYEVLAGMMWNRFGTPTDNAGSGTEEEFDKALLHWRNNGAPHIVFYFCDRPAVLNDQTQLDQRGKVLMFRKKLEELGIVRLYDDLSEFEEQAYKDLHVIAKELRR